MKTQIASSPQQAVDYDNNPDYVRISSLEDLGDVTSHLSRSELIEQFHKSIEQGSIACFHNKQTKEILFVPWQPEGQTMTAGAGTSAGGPSPGNAAAGGGSGVGNTGLGATYTEQNQV